MLQLEVSTRREFHAAVYDAAEAIGSVGGWVVSHQFYSNIFAMIACQIPASALTKFVGALDAVSMSVRRSLPEVPNEIGDIAVQLSITFLNAGPDFKRPVPAFG